MTAKETFSAICNKQKMFKIKAKQNSMADTLHIKAQCLNLMTLSYFTLLFFNCTTLSYYAKAKES